MNEYIANLFTSTLSDGNTYSVKALAEETDCSETTVRDYLKKLPGVESHDAPDRKGKVYFIRKPLTLVEREAEKVELHPIIKEMAAEGEALDLPKVAEFSEAKPKTKRPAPLNPQYLIDAKTAAVKAKGGTLTYANRVWTCSVYGKTQTFTSKEFSMVGIEDLI